MMSEEAITTAINEHRVRNHRLKLEFEQRGVDLQDPRPIDFHFWAWMQRDAAVLARSLYQVGFLVSLLAPAPAENDPDRWSIAAGANVPLVQATGDELTEKLVRIATKEDAVFDGWGTSI